MSKLNVRVAREEDLPAIRQIWDICFDDPIEFTDWYFANKYSVQNTVAYEEGREIAACMQVLPMELIMRGKTCKTGFVVGVSTRPEYRGQGYAGDMLRYSFGLMKKRGMAFTNLYPEPVGFYGYYRRFGYEVGSACQRYLLAGQMLRELPRGGFRIVQGEAGLDFLPLMALYERAMRRFDGYVARDAADWARKIGEWELERHAALLAYDGEELAGYALYTVDKGILDAYEIVYRDDAALCSILYRLGEGHSGKVQCILPVSCPVYSYLSDGRGAMFLEPYGMQRIVDIEAALCGMESVKSGEVCIEVEDDASPDTGGTFALKAQDGVLQAKRGGAAQLKMQISTLSRVVCAMSSAKELWEMGRICGSFEAVSQLDALFPPIEARIFEKY